MGAQLPSCISSALPTSLIVVKWFLLPVVGYEPCPASVPLVIWNTSFQDLSSLSGCFLYSLVAIPDWSWEEVSVASTYSSAILDLTLINFKTLFKVFHSAEMISSQLIE